jgi:hypothetical protein
VEALVLEWVRRHEQEFPPSWNWAGGAV